MKNKEKNKLKIIEALRENSRLSIAEISRRTKLSVSTVKANIHKLKREEIIKSYKALINFQESNLIDCIFLMKCDNEELSELKFRRFINNITRISNYYNLLVEAVFNGIKEYSEFKTELEEKNIEFESFFIISELKRESFKPGLKQTIKQ